MKPSESDRLRHNRERRWILLARDGSHSWLGRETDPSEEEVQAAEEALRRAGIGGFIGVSEGDYWGSGEIAVLWVRNLAGAAEGDFGPAVQAFQERRRKAVAEGS
ncbi:MAG: hypothetical protein DI601_00115 [Azospirillum brasilense]|nr:MAG: hypothetical protein DI601_00115 [Azospirillum brasilense]